MAKDKETGLTDKQKQFCHEYIIDLNATQAAIRAGYAENSANEQGSQILVNLSIQKYISELKALRSERCQITQDEVLNELRKIALSDIRNYYNELGQILSPHELSDKAAASIQGIDVDEIKEYDRDQGQMKVIGVSKKIRLHDKIKALDLLGRHLGVFEKDNSQRRDILTVVTGISPPEGE